MSTTIRKTGVLLASVLFTLLLLCSPHMAWAESPATHAEAASPATQLTAASQEEPERDSATAQGAPMPAGPADTGQAGSPDPSDDAQPSAPPMASASKEQPADTQDEDGGNAEDPGAPGTPDTPGAPEPEPIDIANASATAENALYTGRALTPKLTVTYGGDELRAGTDYTVVSWKDNVAIGTASVLIRGVKDFTGTRTLSFSIFGQPAYTPGATEMPVASTSAWSLTNAVLGVMAGDAVSVNGAIVTAEKEGISRLVVYDRIGGVVATRDVTVSALNGVYVITSGVSGDMVLDICAASTRNGGNAQLYKKNGTQAQAYSFRRSGDAYVILNANSGKAVDVSAGSRTQGANVQQWASNGTNAQKWRIGVDGSNRLTFMNVGSGMALDVSGASRKNGTNVQQWASNGTNAQKWTLSVAPAKYSFGASSMPVAATSAWSLTNAYLAILSGNAVTLNGATVVGAQAGTAEIGVMNSVGEKVASRNVTVYDLDGSYTIDSALGRSLTLDISAASKANGGNAQLYSRNGTMAQTFRFTRSGNAYFIANANSGRVVDVSGGSRKNGANVQQWVMNGTDAQKWRIEADGSNQLTFVSVRSGKALDVKSARAARSANVQQYESNGTNAQKWTLTAADTVYKAGDYIAAAAVALSGFGGKKCPTASGYYTRPPDSGHGGNWTVYNKVYDAMPSSDLTKKRYTDCAGNVALAVKWSGVDDEYPGDPYVSTQRAYMVSSPKWRQIGNRTYRNDEIQKLVKLQPGDILVHPNGDGTYSHMGIYTGAEASDLKYAGQGFDYFQAARGLKKWTHSLKLAKAEYGWYEWEVFRKTSAGIDTYSSKYSAIYPDEMKKYLVSG